MPSIKIKINSNFPLPSLLESDDSELEDLLDDILERGRNLTKKTPAARVPLGIATKYVLLSCSFLSKSMFLLFAKANWLSLN